MIIWESINQPGSHWWIDYVTWIIVLKICLPETHCKKSRFIHVALSLFIHVEIKPPLRLKVCITVDTYINVDSGQREDPGVWKLLEDISEELLAAFVPGYCVELIALQIVETEHGGVRPGQHGVGHPENYISQSSRPCNSSPRWG